MKKFQNFTANKFNIFSLGCPVANSGCLRQSESSFELRLLLVNSDFISVSSDVKLMAMIIRKLSSTKGASCTGHLITICFGCRLLATWCQSRDFLIINNNNGTKGYPTTRFTFLSHDRQLFSHLFSHLHRDTALLLWFVSNFKCRTLLVGHRTLKQAICGNGDRFPPVCLLQVLFFATLVSCFLPLDLFSSLELYSNTAVP